MAILPYACSGYTHIRIGNHELMNDFPSFCNPFFVFFPPEVIFVILNPSRHSNKIPNYPYVNAFPIPG